MINVVSSFHLFYNLFIHIKNKYILILKLF